MKKLCLALLLCACCSASAKAGEDLGTDVGIAFVPSTNWASGQFLSYHEYLDLDFDTTKFTTYEGSIWHKSGLSLGVKADLDDNFVGRAQKIMGYLGYKRFMLRMQDGDLRGTARWNGPAAGGPASTSFNSKFSSVDLLMWGKSDFFYGVGYASYEVPMQVNTEVLNGAGNIVYGNAVYATNAKVKSYAFLFGFDTMQKALRDEASNGFGFWAYTQDRFGVGTLELSDDAVDRAETSNPGRKAMSHNLFSGMVDYDLTLGMYWTANPKKKARVALGLGYMFSGEMVVPWGGGQLTDSSQLRLAPMPYIYRHGVVMKASVKW
ncbi:MAG: hypothetical protein GX410_04995 [Elusimicrobia bacterium]|nr:hypothetical protein [Elusimicrobiota bacterium]